MANPSLPNGAAPTRLINPAYQQAVRKACPSSSPPATRTPPALTSAVSTHGINSVEFTLHALHVSVGRSRLRLHGGRREPLTYWSATKQQHLLLGAVLYSRNTLEQLLRAGLVSASWESLHLDCATTSAVTSTTGSSIFCRTRSEAAAAPADVPQAPPVPQAS